MTDSREYELTEIERARFEALHWERQAWLRHGESLELRERAAQADLVRRVGVHDAHVELDVNRGRIRVHSSNAELGQGVP